MSVDAFMTPRELRRDRPIDRARAAQRKAHAANPLRLQSTIMPLEVGQPVMRHVPAERAAELNALRIAAAYKAAYRSERLQREKR